MHAHITKTEIFIAWWLFSAAMSTMPPYLGSNWFAKWFIAFFNFVAANIDKVTRGLGSNGVAQTPTPKAP